MNIIMINNIVDQITLDCLTNKYFLKKKQLAQERIIIDKKEKKFYRKRILNLTRDLLLKKHECPESNNNEISSSFDNYVKICINYFKALDNNDIIQKELKYIENNETDILNELNLNNNTNTNDNINNYNTEEENKLMMRTLKVKNPLNNFIKKTIINKKEIILPKEKDINLSDPNLRNKGIRKKKNISINYDENN